MQFGDREFRTVQATAIGQQGELFQGAMRDHDGNLRRCLLSLPCANLTAVCTFAPKMEAPLDITPPHKVKALRAGRIALDALEQPALGGALVLESNMVEGKGHGSSTADCIAVVRAAAKVCGHELSAKLVAEIVVRAEAASGSVMFDRAVLFAQREGKVVEDYLQPLPSIAVLGFDTDENRVVETLVFPPAVYSDQELRKLKVLVAALRRAVREQDVELLGRVATASARLNQRFLPKPLFEDVCRVAEKAGALGVAVAHSGTVAGILFDGNDACRKDKMDSLQRALDSFGIKNFRRFKVNEANLC